MNQLVDLDVAACACGVSLATIRRWVRDERLQKIDNKVQLGDALRVHQQCYAAQRAPLAKVPFAR